LQVHFYKPVWTEFSPEKVSLFVFPHQPPWRRDHLQRNHHLRTRKQAFTRCCICQCLDLGLLNSGTISFKFLFKSVPTFKT
uniref:Uncharacterized protein n=1 Tax=Sus scrofa TaxID=9823 RepID=A0A4X1V3Q4_PIG